MPLSHNKLIICCPFFYLKMGYFLLCLLTSVYSKIEGYKNFELGQFYSKGAKYTFNFVSSAVRLLRVPLFRNYCVTT